MRCSGLYVYVYMYVYIYIHIYVHMYIYTYIYICVYTHICMHICTYIYIHIYICTYTHVWESRWSDMFIVGNVFLCVDRSCIPSIQRSATHCNTLQPSAMLCIALQQHAYSLDVSPVYWKRNVWAIKGVVLLVRTLQHTATHCNTLRHTATHCNTLQHTATHRNTLQLSATHSFTLLHAAFCLLWRKYVVDLR